MLCLEVKHVGMLESLLWEWSAVALYVAFKSVLEQMMFEEK